MSKIWKIFARRPNGSENSEDYAAECYQSGVIAVGWNEIGELDQFDSREALKQRLEPIHRKWIPGKSKRKRVASWASSLWYFKESVDANDIVVCPDRKSGAVYVGRIISKRAFYETSPLQGKCDFAHRRKVRWFRPLTRNEVRSVWKGGRFGGRQTVTEVRTGLGQLSRFLRPPTVQKSRRGGNVSWHPDKEWGRLAVIRALKWLGKNAKDVAHLHVGWDIEFGDDKFEVKGRKSFQTTIRLTQNEWTAAKKLGKGYTVLLFTAPTKKKLRTATPRKIPDPARTEKWNEKVTVTREYFLNER